MTQHVYNRSILALLLTLSYCCLLFACTYQLHLGGVISYLLLPASITAASCWQRHMILLSTSPPHFAVVLCSHSMHHSSSRALVVLRLGSLPRSLTTHTLAVAGASPSPSPEALTAPAVSPPPSPAASTAPRALHSPSPEASTASRPGPSPCP